MNTHWTPAEALTYKAQEIIKARSGYTIPWDIIADAIYKPLTELAHTVSVGDTIELPNGATLKVEYKPDGNIEAHHA